MRAVAEAEIGGLRIPWHRGAASVPAFELGPHGKAVGILYVFIGDRRFAQAQLVALVDARTAAQRELHSRRRAQQRRGRFSAAPTGRHAHGVVIGDGPARPPLPADPLELFQHRVHVTAAEVGRKQIETIGHVQLVAAVGVLRHHGAAVAIADLAHGDATGIAVHQPTQPTQEFQRFRLALVVQMVLPGVGIRHRQ